MAAVVVLLLFAAVTASVAGECDEDKTYYILEPDEEKTSCFFRLVERCAPVSYQDLGDSEYYNTIDNILQNCSDPSQPALPSRCQKEYFLRFEASQKTVGDDDFIILDFGESEHVASYPYFIYEKNWYSRTKFKPHYRQDSSSNANLKFLLTKLELAIVKQATQPSNTRPLDECGGLPLWVFGVIAGGIVFIVIVFFVVSELRDKKQETPPPTISSKKVDPPRQTTSTFRVVIK